MKNGLWWRYSGSVEAVDSIGAVVVLDFDSEREIDAEDDADGSVSRDEDDAGSGCGESMGFELAAVSFVPLEIVAAAFDEGTQIVCAGWLLVVEMHDGMGDDCEQVGVCSNDVIEPVKLFWEADLD